MTWRTIQKGPDGTILCWHLGSVAAQIGADVPGWTVLLASGDSDQPPPDVRGRVALVGYSAGCQGVRSALLRALAAPCAVVTIDGTHSSLPPAAAHVDCWQRLAARARRGDALWLATCLAAHTYVESIPTGHAGRAAATVTVLEAATGLALRATCDRPASGLVAGRVTGRPAEHRLAHACDDGALHVRSYHSAPIDHAEHAAQAAIVLPALWREIAAPHLRSLVQTDAHADPDAAPPTSRSPGVVPPRSLGERIADVCREYVGTAEQPGPGTNLQIASMLYPCRRRGTAVAGMLDATGDRILGDQPADSVAWCAAFRSFCVFLAGDYTDTADICAVPHGYRCSVAELCADARQLGTLRPRDAHPARGWAAIWKRDGGDPLAGGTGHVSTVISADAEGFTTIGGNERDAVREQRHTYADPSLVAWIAVG